MELSRRARLLPAMAALFMTFASWCAAATVYWTGEGGDGSWHTATNWREGFGDGSFDAAGPQRLPTSADTATIDDGDPNTTTTVVHSQAVTTDLAALASAESVQITAGSVDFDNGATVGDAGGLVLVAGGSLSIDNGGTIASDITITSGQLSMSNTAVFEGALVAQGGTVDFANGATITGSVLLQGATLSLANGTALSGTMTVESGDVTLSKNADITGSVVIEGGNVSLDNGASVSDFTVSDGSLTLTGSADLGEFTMTGGDVTLADGADVTSLSITGGSITFEGTATVADVTVDGGALEFQGATTVSGSMAVTDGTVTIAAGASLDAASLSISGGTFSVAAGATLSATSMEVSGGTVTIDGDASFDSLSVTGGTISGAGFPSVPRVDFAVSAFTLSEEAGSVTLTVDLTDDVGAPLASALDIAIVLSVAGVATRNTDYTITDANYVDGTLTLTIPGGVGNTSGVVTVTGTSDALHEGSEDIVLGITSIANALSGTTTSQTLALTDDDTAPAVTFDAATATVGEAAGPATIGVSLSAVSGLDATIPYTVAGAATGAGTDHDLADGSLTIAAGSTTGSISLTVTADALDEDDETVVVTITTGSLGNATAGATTAHTLTIADDDAIPSVTFAADAQSVAESASSVSLTASLSAVSGRDVTVPYTVSGTAVGSGTDHDLADGSLTIPAGSPDGAITFTVVDDALNEDAETIVGTMTTGSLTNATAGATTNHTVTVTDNDATPTVAFAAAAQSIAESAGSVSVSVALSAVSGRDVTVPYTVSGTAVGSGADHDLADGSLTIAAGSPSGAITFNLTDDTLAEGDETVVVSMATGSLTNATAGGITEHTVTVTDADNPPAVTFSAATQSVAESAVSVSIAVDLGAISGLDATVPYTVSGTAVGSGTDHDLADGSLVIAAGGSSGTITFAPTDDALHEADETVIVTITTASLVNADAGAVTVHTTTIGDDDDPPTVTFDAATATAAESAGSVTIGVTLSAASGLDVTMPYTVAGSATGSGTDHDLADGSLTIAAGSTGDSISLTVTEDVLDEDDEIVVVSMTTGSLTNASAGATTSHALTITDNDATPSVNFSAAAQPVAESVGGVAATVDLEAVSGRDVTVPYTVSGSATGSGTDHDLADGTLVILAGLASGTITFNATADTMDEPDETVVVSIPVGSLVNATDGAVTTHTATIADDDDAPTVAFAAASQSVAEAVVSASISVELSAVSGFDVTVPYTVAGTATAADHDLAAGSLVIAAGSPAEAISFGVTDDALDEADETVIVSMTTASLVNAGAGATTTHTVTIADGDSAPTVTFDAATSTAVEGDGTVSIGVTMGAVSALDATIPYTVSGTATGSGTDHGLADGSLTVAAGSTVGALSVTLTDDALDELDEAIVVSITTGSLVNATPGATTTHTLTMTDDDDAPTVTFGAATSSAVEGVGAVAIGVTLSGASGLDATIPYTVSGTATGSGTDHDLVDGVLTIPAGSTGGAFGLTLSADALHELDETVVVSITDASLVNVSAGVTTTHTLTVTDDDDPPTVTFDATTSAADEGVGAVAIGVAISGVSGLDATIPYTVSGTATGSGTDHDLADGFLTIPAGSPSGAFDFTLADDALHELDETIIVSITTASLVNASAGATTSHTLTITDDDAAPAATFDASASTAGESAGIVTIGVTLGAVSELAATIPFTVSGTATGAGTDHDLVDGSLTIAVGSTTATVTLTLSDDALDELDETVVVSMATGSLVNASAGATTSHTLTITDDDATPTVTFAASAQTAAESVGSVSVTASLAAVSGLDVTVPFTVSGTATGSGTDHDLVDGNLVIAAGSPDGTISFTVTDDSLDELDETVIVSMTTASLINATAGAVTAHTVTVTDNDETSVTFAASAQSVAESVPAIGIAVTLSVASASDVTIPYTVSGTASAGSVDHSLTDGSLTIAAGSTFSSVTAALNDDALDENDETIVVTMTTASLANAVAGGVTVHTVTLTDDDAPPTVGFVESVQTVAEAAPGAIEVGLSGASGLDVTVPYTVSGTATGSGTDHDLADASLTILAGSTTGTIDMTASDDALDELDETVVVAITTAALTNASAGATTSHTLTIADDDDPPVVTFSTTAQTVAEAVGSVTATVVLDAVSGLDVIVPYTVSGTATGGGTDHDLADSSLTIAAGSSSGTVGFTVTDDSLDETDETVIVSMTTASLANASVGAVTAHTATITDNDEASVAFAASTQTVAESAGTIAIAVTLSIESAFDVTVPYTVSGSAAGGSVDHAFADGSVVVTAGTTFGSVTAAVTDDALDEDDETIVVTMATGSLVNATAGAVTEHTITLTDNDAAPTVAFSAGAQTRAESIGAVTVTVYLSGVSALDVTVPYTTSGDATGSGIDHDLADGSLTIAAGLDSGAISVAVTADTMDEPDETVVVSMTTGSLTNATAGILTTHTVTITDDDDPPLVSFATSAQSVAEGDGSASIAVDLSAVSGFDITAPYTFSGTATGSGTDHDLVDGSLTIAAGSSGGTIAFTLTDDSLDEPDETVIVSMTTGSLVNATAGGVTSHTATVTDNDEVIVVFAASSQTASEATGTIAIAVTLSIESTSDVTVPYTVSGTASGGSVDHDLADGALTIAAGTTFDSIAAAITDDALDEDDESIVVSMTTGSLVNATAGAFTTHTVTLTDDDSTPTVEFSSSAQTVAEGVGTVTFAAALSAVSGRVVTVPYTVGGTASGSGIDHDLSASTITIAAGDTTGSASFSVVNDTLEEGDETVVVALDGASLVNATEGGQNSHTITITITDNDAPPVGTAQAVTTAEDTPVAITLAGTDGDGDALTYTVTTDPSNGTLSGTAPDVTYTPTGDYAGPDTVGFTVNDGQSDAAEATVTVTVTEVNDAPTLPAFAGQTVAEDAGSVTITLTGIDAGGGADEDAQSITISATSDTPAVVPDPTLTASPFTEGGSDPTLTFTPAASAAGSATITVTAQDDGSTDGSLDSQSVVATVQVTVVPVSEASLTVSSGGESHVLQFGFSANAADGLDTSFADRVSSASGSVIGAAFSRGGASLERDIAATPTGNSLSWTLTVDALAAQDTDVTITWTQADVDALLADAGAFNSAFLVASTSETYSLSDANNGFSTTVEASGSATWTLTIEKSSVRTTRPVQILLTADTWHLLSLPGAGDLTPLAAYNVSAFMWDAANELYAAVTDLSAVSAVASGLFFFSSDTVTVPLELDVDAADARQAAVTLSPGWNLVGAPATQNDTNIWGEAPASQLTDGAANRVFGYDGAGSYSAATTLTEGAGYWALNPDGTDSAVTVTQARHLNGAVTQYHATPDARVPDWSATLTLSGASDASSVTVGVSPDAAAGYDSMDMPQPPPAIGGTRSAFYVATDDVVGRLTRSVQPAALGGAEWSIVVDGRGQTTLAWEGVSPPMGYRVALSTSDSEWDLRRRGSTRVSAGRHELTARLLRDVPAITALLPNYPNPFNPETW
ncbi:hypothetical protein HN937_04570, partial [Candidatus Poribacteria bacterium]|nr:hypothetical protein [Candidatus Poribacteria bacterium]